MSLFISSFVCLMLSCVFSRTYTIILFEHRGKIRIVAEAYMISHIRTVHLAFKYETGSLLHAYVADELTRCHSCDVLYLAVQVCAAYSTSCANISMEKSLSLIWAFIDFITRVISSSS